MGVGLGLSRLSPSWLRIEKCPVIQDYIRYLHNFGNWGKGGGRAFRIFFLPIMPTEKYENKTVTITKTSLYFKNAYY